MQQKASVIETQSGKALVRIAGTDCDRGCNCCQAFAGDKRPELTVDNPINAQPGQRVLIEFDPAQALKSSVLLFLVPILALIAGGVAGDWIGRIYFPKHHETIGVLAAGMLLIASLLAIAINDRRVRKNRPPLPKIIEILPGTCSENPN